MNKLSIVTYPEKILKKRAEEVKNITIEIRRLVPEMIEAMYENEGIGLAAPQIGIGKRIIIVETADKPREAKTNAQGKPIAFLNPVIVKKSGTKRTEEEGCLSLPGVFVPVKRADHIEVAAQTPEGEKIKIEAGGLIARIFQHEIDHINGKLIIDRVLIWKRISLKRSLKSKDKTSSPKS